MSEFVISEAELVAEEIILDPDEVAVERTELDINSGGIRIRQEGVDWGNSEIQTYMAEQARGSSPVDYRIPNRTITLPLILAEGSGWTFAQSRSKIASKIARIQQEGGWLKRVLSTGGTVYADLVNASLSLSGGWLQAHRGVDIDALLVLEAIPDFYGEEVTLSDHTETSAAELVFTETGIAGDYPARVRVVVDDDSGQNQRGLIWAFRSRHYSSAATAATRYEAEALQALDTATKVAKVGASGGTVVTHGTLSTNWTPVVGTNIGGSAFLTHTGTNRIFARVLSTSGTLVQSRFVWDVGDLVYPAENDAVRCYDGGTFHILDLGEVRLDPVPTGAHRWQGQIQAKGDVGSENFSVDRVWIVNCDEGMGIDRAPLNLSEGLVTYSARSEFNTEGGAITGDSLAVGGTWTGAGDTDDFTVAAGVATRTATSDTGNGRVIVASTPTLTSCVVQHDFTYSTQGANQRSGPVARYVDINNFLRVQFLMSSTSPVSVDIWAEKIIGGSITLITNPRGFPSLAGENVARKLTLHVAASGQFAVYADRRLLFTGFDAALATGGTLASGKAGINDWNVGGSCTRTYDNFVAWVPADDAVLYASRSAELSTLGMTRQDTGGTAYGPVSNVSGDLPRIPPAGLEGRTTEVFLKASRGDIQTLNDPAIDDLSARVFMRASWLLVPES